MERIAAIVEGHTEAHFIRATHASVLISRSIPNGRSVATEVIVEAIVDALELMSGSITKVLILLDREGREISAEDLATQIRDGVESHCGSRRLYIGVSDRQIENWIVADEEEMVRRFDPAFVYQGDGCSGKPLLRQLNKGVSLGPRDTALLLAECSAQRAQRKSGSLATLLQMVDFEWHWASV